MTDDPHSAGTGVVVCGVRGRMGRLIAAAAVEDGRATVFGGSVGPGRPGTGEDIGRLLGRDALGTNVSETLADALAGLDDQLRSRAVVVDFTKPAALAVHLDACIEAGVGVVVGTTGLDEGGREALDRAAKRIPVLYAANTSLGANLLAALTRLAARALPDAEVEIVELHHRAKADSPSGTALLLAEQVVEERGLQRDQLVTARSGHAPRGPGSVGVFGVRGGTVPGEHTVHLFLDDERVELTHRVQDRSIFARGAVAAARFLRGKPAGRYSMAEVLGL